MKAIVRPRGIDPEEADIPAILIGAVRYIDGAPEFDEFQIDRGRSGKRASDADAYPHRRVALVAADEDAVPEIKRAHPAGGRVGFMIADVFGHTLRV